MTSVDTIYLLEQLVNVRVTVEEKNRIRRNLEGFRPLTVSKAKADSEEFFKVIMGFPVPKPRNIEKDVKVFSWKILSHALKKIISKYVSHLAIMHGVKLISSSLQATPQRLVQDHFPSLQRLPTVQVGLHMHPGVCIGIPHRDRVLHRSFQLSTHPT